GRARRHASADRAGRTLDPRQRPHLRPADDGGPARAGGAGGGVLDLRPPAAGGRNGRGGSGGIGCGAQLELSAAAKQPAGSKKSASQTNGARPGETKATGIESRKTAAM